LLEIKSALQGNHALMNATLKNDAKPMETISFFEVVETEANPIEQDIQAEYIVPLPYELKYACLLIPRFPSHQLKGDIVQNLHQWLQQICVSYGWRLEFIEVNPDFIQYILCVNMTVSPDQFMKIITQQTSQLIFSNFGRIRQENLSNDFWANGYLVMSGEKAIQNEMIAQFITMCRRQQGLNTL
jgi:REP element-mobilizing transposase RayT